MKKCKYCGVATKSVSSHMRNCSDYISWRDKTFTKEFLYQEYVENGKSAIQIANEHGLSSSTAINKLLKKYNFNIRGISSSHAMPLYKKRVEQTNMDRFGAPNPLCKGTESFKKRNKTVMERYGVDNVRKHSGVIDKIKKSLAEWRRENGHSTHGMVHSSETKKKMRHAAINNIESRSGQLMPAYNTDSIPIIEAKANEFGITDLQHAENGGEYYIKELGYWVDGYSKEKNIVIEYDEKHHFDIDGNLKDKDKARQREIENYLGCEFIRIKETERSL